MSTIPTRRTTRVTRPAVMDDRSAVARPARLRAGSTTTAPLTTSSQALDGNTKTVRAAAAALKAESAAALKRKRAPQELPIGKKGKDAKDGKGGVAGATAAGSRNPLAERTALRALNDQRITRSTAPEKKAGDEELDAMVVDLPAATNPARTTTRRVSTRATGPTTAIPTTTTASSTTTAARRPVAPTAKKIATTTSTARARTGARRIPVHTTNDDEEADVKPVSKRRRTSSIGAENKPVEPVPTKVREDNAVVLPLKKILQEDDEVRQITPEEAAAHDEQKWEDLDKEDEDDPLMVAEYVIEIYDYLKLLEKQTMPNPRYMDHQRELAWKMRGILMDWLIQVHAQFRLLPETLFLAVNIIDRFLTARVVSLAKLQLVGITAMFIASKYEEIMAPTVDNFLSCAERSYDEKAILEAEKYLLRTIDWNLSYPNPIHFLRRASKADGYDIQTRTVAKYFIEISCVEWRLLGTVPSMIAAAAIWFARLVLDRDEWTPNLQHYASYAEEAILPTANIMLNFVLRPIRHEAFFNKYASKKYMKASTYVRDWAISKWGEEAGGSVRLEDYLDELKMASKKRRELAELEDQPEDTF